MANPNRRVAAAIAFLLLVGNLRTVAGQSATPIPSPLTPDPSARDIAPVHAQAAYRLALLVPFPDDPFWQSVERAVADRAGIDGVAVDVFALSAPNVPEQLDQLSQAIAAGYAGILLGPVDAVAVAPGIAAANAAGVPVLAIDTAPIGGSVISVVRTDNIAAARIAGQFLGQFLGDQGTVLNIQGDLTNPVAQERDQGLREGLVPFAHVKIESVEGSWQSGSAYGWTAQQLPQAGEGTPTPPQPLIDAVFAAGPEMAMGAAQAVEDAKADTVTVVGFGATPDTLGAVKSGLIEGVVAELPTRAGVLAVDLMVRHLNGGSVPASVNSGALFVTEETLDAYVAAST